jgi:hypothetical protein
VLKGLKEAGGVIEAAAKWWVVRADQHWIWKDIWEPEVCPSKSFSWLNLKHIVKLQRVSEAVI